MHKRQIARVLVLIVGVGFAQPQVAAAGDARWINIRPMPMLLQSLAGQQYAGRVASVAVDPSNLAHWLFGTAHGGVWETFDSGANWAPRTDAQPSLAMGAIAFAPGNPSIVYAGTGEPNFIDSYAGAGLLKSTDGGTGWQLLAAATFTGTAFGDLRVDPANPDVVVAATVRSFTGRSFQRADLPAAGTGIFESTDGGVSWSKRLNGQATSLVVDPTSFAGQYAGIGLPLTSGPPMGVSPDVYRSLDGGNTWAPISGPWTAIPPRSARSSGRDGQVAEPKSSGGRERGPARRDPPFPGR